MQRAAALFSVIIGLLYVFGVPGRAEARITSLWTDQICAGDGTVSVRLTWGPLDAHAVDQWLDLAWDDPWTEAELQQTSTPFSAGTNNIDWRGLTPDTTYYARVTQRFSANFVSASPVFSFKTAACNSTQPGEIVSIRSMPSSPAAPAPVTTAKPSPSSSSDDCDTESYPDTCIPMYPPELDCDDIPVKNFKVRPPDPHGFDPDEDGIGCETSTPPVIR
jgi:hypothetical protein